MLSISFESTRGTEFQAACVRACSRGPSRNVRYRRNRGGRLDAGAFRGGALYFTHPYWLSLRVLSDGISFSACGAQMVSTHADLAASRLSHHRRRRDKVSRARLVCRGLAARLRPHHRGRLTIALSAVQIEEAPAGVSSLKRP